MTSRVLLVDDDAQVRRSLRLMLRFETELEVIGDTATAAEATRTAADLQPDIVLLDLGLPDLAGREVLTAIRAVAPRSRVVVFTGREPDDQQYWAQHTAAYVMKGSDVEELLDVLRSEAARGASVGRGTGARVLETVTAEFPGVLDSIPRARTFLREHLQRWQLPVDDAALVVTELAANAVRHAGTSFTLRLSRTPASVRIEVDDASELTPEPQPWSDTAESGRGMVLVSVLARSWGIEPLPSLGKTVWAEIDMPPSAGP